MLNYVLRSANLSCAKGKFYVHRRVFSVEVLAINCLVLLNLSVTQHYIAERKQKETKFSLAANNLSGTIQDIQQRLMQF